MKRIIIPAIAGVVIAGAGIVSWTLPHTAPGSVLQESLSGADLARLMAVRAGRWRIVPPDGARMMVSWLEVWAPGAREPRIRGLGAIGLAEGAQTVTLRLPDHGDALLRLAIDGSMGMHDCADIPELIDAAGWNLRSNEQIASDEVTWALVVADRPGHGASIPAAIEALPGPERVSPLVRIRSRFVRQEIGTISLDPHWRNGRIEIAGGR